MYGYILAVNMVSAFLLVLGIFFLKMGYDFEDKKYYIYAAICIILCPSVFYFGIKYQNFVFSVLN